MNTPTTRPPWFAPTARLRTVLHRGSHPAPGPPPRPPSLPLRLVMVLLSLQGYPASTIAERFGSTPPPCGAGSSAASARASGAQRPTPIGAAAAGRPPARGAHPTLAGRVSGLDRGPALGGDPIGTGSDGEPLAAAAAPDVSLDLPGSP